MSHARTTFIVSLAAASLSALIVLLIPRRTTEPPRPLARPTYLSEREREELHRHMNRHGAEMIELSRDVVMLDDEAAAASAERIAAEPALAPGLGSLPSEFYPLQNEMLAAAVRLGQAARSHDGKASASAYGQLATTCVACHRVYLRR